VRAASGSILVRKGVDGSAPSWGGERARGTKPTTPSERDAHSNDQKMPGLLPPVVEAHCGGIEVVERLADEWCKLCDEAFDDQPFYRPEWIGAYLRAFAPRKPILLITARMNDRLKAVLPLIEDRTWLWGFPLRRIHSAANVHCLRFDLLRSASPEGLLATRAIWEFLRDSVKWDVLEMSYVPSNAALEDLIVAAKENGFQTECKEPWHSPYIPLRLGNGTEETWLQETPTKFRANLRRRWRNLSTQGPLVLHRLDKVSSDLLEGFYDLEQSGWKGRTGGAIRLNRQTRQFYDEIAQAATRFGYLSLYVLKSNGRNVAAHFGLSYGGRYFLSKPAYDEAYARFSPGHLLVHAVLGDCVKRGYNEFDFMGDSDNWKREWTMESRTHKVWYVFGKTRKGCALHALLVALKYARRKLMVLDFTRSEGNRESRCQRGIG
jgi:CelD/BcsL family acetyltransferase involved in cellulose biosynthesis